MTQENQRETFIIHRIEDIPEFPSEDDEGEFWGARSFSDDLLEEMGPDLEGILPPPRAERLPQNG